MGQRAYVNYRLDCFFKKINPSIKCFIESFLFATDNVLNVIFFSADFRENVAERVSDDIDEFVKKRFVETERPSVADSAAENSAQNVIAVGVSGKNSVRDGKTECANMIG